MWCVGSSPCHFSSHLLLSSSNQGVLLCPHAPNLKPHLNLQGQYTARPANVLKIIPLTKGFYHYIQGCKTPGSKTQEIKEDMTSQKVSFVKSCIFRFLQEYAVMSKPFTKTRQPRRRPALLTYLSASRCPLPGVPQLNARDL